MSTDLPSSRRWDPEAGGGCVRVFVQASRPPVREAETLTSESERLKAGYQNMDDFCL